MSSEAESITRGEGISVHPIACLSDNYAYLLVDNKEKACAAVDPVNAERVLSTIKQLGLSLRCVLTTHHHSDHAGGNAELLSLLAADSSAAPVPVYGGDERVLALSHQVGHDDVIAVSERLSVRVLFTPCHTRGHVLYYAADPSSDRSVLFTGDTLFIGGCGRFFEGNGEQMDTALNHVIKALPSSTQVYCGHEYTIANLEFAKSVEPHNEAIDRKLAWARAQRERGVPTVPSLLAEEFEYNPFMRLDSAEILSSLQLSSDAPIHERMDKLRVTKNNFK